MSRRSMANGTLKLDRRSFLKTSSLAGIAGVLGHCVLHSSAQESVQMPFENGERPLVKYPQKRPLIRITTRPPQLETPFGVFNEGFLTPNDAFFVRYHLSEIPLSVDEQSFRLEINGKVKTPLTLSL